MQLRSDRAGFAMPMVIMIIGFMTAGVLAAFARSTSEVRYVDNERAATAAFAVAEAGLGEYVARGKIVPADTTFTIGGGSAHVTATLMKPRVTPEDTAVWLIRSVGTLPGGVGRPPARRTVAQFAHRIGASLHVVSAWTSISGLQKNGASGSIQGADACTSDVLAGVAVPDGGFGGLTNSVSGDPAILPMGTTEEMADQIMIDWVGIMDPSNPAIIPDFILCLPGTYAYDPNWGPCTGWPSETKMLNDPDYWPVVLINGSSPLPTDGKGTLLVTGNLTFGGGDIWDGIILVGGRIDDNGSGAISGAVITGLNLKRPDPWPSTVTQSSIADGTKDYVYDSCKVARANEGQARLVQIANAWADNWNTW
jgi:hypothetical protein